MEKQTYVKIANNCLGYDYEGEDNFTSSLTPEEGSKSCVNCSHFYKGNCQFGLIEKVLNKLNRIN